MWWCIGIDKGGTGYFGITAGTTEEIWELEGGIGEDGREKDGSYGNTGRGKMWSL